MLVHEGSLVPNNSILYLEDIETSPLHCITTLQNCCDTNRLGNWFPPSSQEGGGAEEEGEGPLGSSASGDLTELFQSWGDDRSVQLNGRNGSDIDGGLYRCEIPDADSITQTFYVGVYQSAAQSEYL